MILYEYPFNERIRTYLRLEHLFLRLGELVARYKVKSPALIVIGEVAAEPTDQPLQALALEAFQ